MGCTIYLLKNKSADQLHDYRAADLHLCFRICKKQVFSCRGSNLKAQLIKPGKTELDEQMAPRDNSLWSRGNLSVPDQERHKPAYLFIRITCPCVLYPLTPHFYMKNRGLQGLHYFLIFALKHILCEQKYENSQKKIN